MADPYQASGPIEPHDLEQRVRAGVLPEAAAKLQLETGRGNGLVPRYLDREIAGARESSVTGRGR